MNNQDIYLIDEGYVKTNSSLMDNVEASFFTEFIIISQNIQLQGAIGITLYTAIITQFEAYKEALKIDPNADITDSVEERILTLVDDYIQLVLLYYTLYHAIYNFQIKYTNKGTEIQTSQYSKSPSQGSIENQRQQWKGYAEHYMVELITFLEENVVLYPEYSATCDTASRTNPFGLYLGGAI